MKRKKRSFLFWLALLTYGAVLTGALLYFRFPAAKANRYLAAQTSRFAEGVKVEIGRCGYGLPVELQCDTLRFVEEQTGEELLQIETLTLSPVLKGFGLEYRVAGAMAGGTFVANARMVRRLEQLELRGLELTDIDLTLLPTLHKGLQRDIKGVADFRGALSLTREGGKIPQGTLTIRDGILPFRQQILLVEQQPMAPMNVELGYRDGRVQLTKGSLKSDQLTFNFNGEVQLGDSLASSEMNLTGSIVADPQYIATNPSVQRVVRRLQRQFKGETLPFMVSGNLLMPRFRFGER